MKKYDTNYIRSYIESHRSEICCVLCGLVEVWLGSACAVFCNGNYCIDLFKLNSRMGNGTHKTPYMEVIFNDGTISYLMCGEEIYNGKE